MGEIRATVTLENRDDRGAVRLGLRTEADVRRTRVEGVVDTGAVSLVIPEEIATELGLPHEGTRTVVYADERREERPVTNVTIEIEVRLDGFDERLRSVEVAFGKVGQRLLTIERWCFPRRRPASSRFSGGSRRRVPGEAGARPWKPLCRRAQGAATRRRHRHHLSRSTGFVHPGRSRYWVSGFRFPSPRGRRLGKSET